MEREAAKKQEELFAMEKLNDALNEKLKSLSMEVCEFTTSITEYERLVDPDFERLIDLGTSAQREA